MGWHGSRKSHLALHLHSSFVLPENVNWNYGLQLKLKQTGEWVRLHYELWVSWNDSKSRRKSIYCRIFFSWVAIVYPSFISKYILFSLKQNFYILNSKWSPDKVPIDWLWSDWMEKYLALSHDAQALLPLVCTSWPWAKYFPAKSFHLVKYMVVAKLLWRAWLQKQRI